MPLAIDLRPVGAKEPVSVRPYLAEQNEHHRTKTFQEEFLEFLARHGCEYDERYVWD